MHILTTLCHSYCIVIIALCVLCMQSSVNCALSGRPSYDETHGTSSPVSGNSVHTHIVFPLVSDPPASIRAIVSDPPASIRDPACIRDPASIRTTRFTDEHVFKTPRFLVLYLLLQILQSEIPGRPYRRSAIRTDDAMHQCYGGMRN